ncbi:alcohol dehydrogenase catalytic domain-containing protein [Mycolicibacterium sp.]|uniref:alcohol dehydrogenase catalytic domain-containing protein n=1 Tax=Mycolicibacterium sp. TaxID=2320850 RepID=UPI003D127609
MTRNPIRAAVLEQPGKPLRMQTLFLDEPTDHEVVVRTERAGLCHSDRHYVTGALSITTPAVLGHEVAGVVERVGGAVTRLRPGDRVVATVTPPCGACASCVSGRPTQCARVEAMRLREQPRVVTADGTPVASLGGVGAFAERFLAHEQALARVDPAVSPAVACLLGCCITTGVGAVLHGAHVTPADTVAVIGCGGVGIAAVQGARLAGARRIVAVDALGAKLELAQRFGATDTVLADPDPAATLAAIRRILPAGVTRAFEAVGHPATAELAFAALAPTGVATILGLMPEGRTLTIPADELIYGDRVLQGAYMGANRFLADIDVFCDHYAAGRLDLDAMVTDQIPFEAINDGLAAMAEPTTIRIVVDFEAGIR